jgi:hypothetical protein
MTLSDAVIKAAQTLIEKYESLTLKDVQRVNPKEITGFAQVSACPLCKSVEYIADDGAKCGLCIYGSYIACTEGEHKDSYYAIKNAATPIELLKAYYDRAQHIRALLKADAEAKEKEAREAQRAVDLSPLKETQYNDPITTALLLCVRSGGDLAYKAFYLASAFDWEIKKDRSENLWLVPTRKI